MHYAGHYPRPPLHRSSPIPDQLCTASCPGTPKAAAAHGQCGVFRFPSLSYTPNAWPNKTMHPISSWFCSLFSASPVHHEHLYTYRQSIELGAVGPDKTTPTRSIVTVQLSTGCWLLQAPVVPRPSIGYTDMSHVTTLELEWGFQGKRGFCRVEAKHLQNRLAVGELQSGGPAGKPD